MSIAVSYVRQEAKATGSKFVICPFKRHLFCLQFFESHQAREVVGSGRSIVRRYDSICFSVLCVDAFDDIVTVTGRQTLHHREHFTHFSVLYVRVVVTTGRI